MQDEPVAVADLPSPGGSGNDQNELDERQCRQCLAGDNRACGELLKRYEPRIARLMWRFTRNRTEHVELVQETMVQVYTSLPRFRWGKAPLEHWVMRIATRTGYQFWRSQKRRRNLQPLDEVDPPAPAEAGQMDATAAAAALHNLLAELPPADRLVLTLMYFEQCSLREIAKRAGWNETIVKMRVYRARQRLKKLIEEKKMTEFLMGISHGSA
jgi:RNA polymerase sigma-70 factor (ECF subfamily)